MSQRSNYDRNQLAGGRNQNLPVHDIMIDDAEEPLNDNIIDELEVVPPDEGRNNQNLIMLRMMRRRVQPTNRRRRHIRAEVHNMENSASRNRGQEGGHGMRNFSVNIPPSPPDFSSDSLADDSDFSGFSDFDDRGLRAAEFRLREEVQSDANRSDLRLPNYFRHLPDQNRPGPSGDNRIGGDMPGTSRGHVGDGNVTGARGNKRPLLSSSSDSCVETGYTSNRNAADSMRTVENAALLLPLAQSLQRLRSNGEFTDVKLIVEDKEIACHRVVLAACSQYFHALLTSDMREGREHEVTIKGHKFEVVELLVKHAYAESIQIKEDNAQDIVEAADYFQLDVLKSYCEAFLMQQVSEPNCLGLMQFAMLHSLDTLALKAKRFALRNFRKVSQQEEYLRLPVEALVRYLSDDTLRVQREEHVFHAAMCWLKYDDNRAQNLVKVLKCVRLLFVSPHFLFDTIAKDTFLQGKPEVQELISEACKYHALGSNEWKQMQQPHTKPRNASGITEVLLVVGGICNNRRLHHTEYYSAKRGWQPLADISTAHGSMHSYSVCTHKNDVYITGGHSNCGTTTNAASLYLSNINQWSELAGMINPRERHGSATVDGAVYVAGGLMASQKGRKKPIVLDQVERYRPAFNQWEKVKPLPKRCYSPGVISYKEKLYVIGGVSMTEEPSNSSKIILNCIQCYDPLTDRWTMLALGRPLARLCCTLYQDCIYMISNNASEIFRYNPNAQMLEEWRALPEPGLEFAGLATYNGHLVITGGQKENNTLNQMFIISYESKEVIDTITMTRSLCMHGCVPIDKFG